MDSLSRVLVEMTLGVIGTGRLIAIVDDTLCRKSGPHVWGAGVHYDPLASTYGRGAGARQSFFAFGHSWVVVSLWVPFPWNAKRGIAIPVLFRLYRSKKLCPEKLYRKRTELAGEMIALLADWVGAERPFLVVGDREYTCETLVKSLPPRAHLVGPMPMNAAVYARPLPQTKGRPRKKGVRLSSPEELARVEPTPWEDSTVLLYSRRVAVRTKTQDCLWYGVAGSRPGRLVVTRDPKGHLGDRAYYSTDPNLSTADILEAYACRWTQEVMYRDAKQLLGVDQPRNGWWRRRTDQPRAEKKAGPNAHAVNGSQAAFRTVPFIMCVYALIVFWYFKHGDVSADVRAVTSAAPWYRQKREPCFADMVTAARRCLWSHRVSTDPRLAGVTQNPELLIPPWLLAA